MAARTIAFGPFVLDLDSGTLARNGEFVALGQKAIALLATLATGPGTVLTKAALMDAAWPGTTVEENNLSVQIAALRKALGPRADGGEWIATVPRVGYRFVGDTRSAAPALRTETVVPSLAVLPFETLGGDAGETWFADGIVEDLITALSSFRSFAVVARNSSFVYRGRAIDVRQVAAELGVRYVLQGSVRRDGTSLRITAQLVDGTTGTHLWAERFDGDLAGVFGVQDRITERTVGVVEPQIRQAEIERARRKRPESLDAYDFYLRALALMDSAGEASSAEAYALATRALALEPDYGPFLATAIWALTRRVVLGWPTLTSDDRSTALDLVRRALVAAGGDAAVLAQCGATLIGIGRDYEGGMQAIAGALELNPNNLLVLTCAAIAELHCGDLGRSLAYSHRVLVMSPRAPTAYIAMTATAHAHMAVGAFTEALAAAERSLAINPNFPPTWWMLVAANAQLGRLDEAKRRAEELRRLSPGITLAGIAAGQAAYDPSRMQAILDGLRRAGIEPG